MIKFEPSDLQAIWLTLKLASTTTLLLLMIATPLAWWLVNTKRWYKGMITALMMMPLILPPTVLGFYLLTMMGPHGLIGKLTHMLQMNSLPFTFSGLVIGSVIFSLPFAVIPIQNAFESTGKGPLEAASTLRAGYWDRFFTVALPLAKPGFFSAIILTFTHTVGEFGVVLMLGGNIPGETQVMSIAIYNHVEALEYNGAHLMSGAMVLFSFIVLLILNLMSGRFFKGFK